MFRIFRHYVSGLAFVLFLGDLAVILGAFYLAELVAPWAGWAPAVLRFLEVATLITFIFHLGDLYHPRHGLGQRELLGRVLVCQAIAAILLATIGFAVPMLRLSRSAFLMIFLLTTPGL